MITGLFGAVKAAAIGVAHSVASIGKSALEGIGILERAGIEIEPTAFESVFDLYEDLPRLRQDIYDCPSDRLIPGRLHKDTVFVAKDKYFYILGGEYIDEKGEPASAILTLDRSKRMSLDEIMESSELMECQQGDIVKGADIEWELIEAYYGI